MRKVFQKSALSWARILSAISLFSVFLLICAPSFAQEVTAAINGVITDPSGAAISGAKVTVKDLDRGTVFPASTDSVGRYSLPRLPVGRYEVRAENPGFQTAIQSPVVLVLNQVAKIDFQMAIGDVNQTVEVTASAPILQTQTTQLGTVLDARTNVSLPSGYP